MATLRTQSTEPKIIEGTSRLEKNEGSFTSLQIKNEFKDQEVMGLIQSLV